MMVNIINSQDPEEKFSFLQKNTSKITSISSKNNELYPEIVTVDLANPGAKNQILFLVQNEPMKVILAINASGKEQMLEAIACGSSGSSIKEIEQGEMQLVLQSLRQECILVDSKRKNYPHFLVLPKTQILSKLENYQYVLGVEIINYWRGQSFPVPISINWMLEELAVLRWSCYLETGQEKLLMKEELERLISSLRHNNEPKNLTQKLEYMSSFVENWYFKRVYSTVNRKARDLRKKSISKIKKISNFWMKGGSYTLSMWLEEAISTLQMIEVELEQKRQEAFKRNNLILVAFKNLTEKLEQNPRQEDFESALRGLKLRYLEMITFEVTGAVMQIVTEVIEIFETQRKQVIESDTLLYNFQEKLQRQKEELGFNDSFSENVWSSEELENLGISAVRRDLEQEAEKSLNYWSKLSVEKYEMMYLKILEKTRKLSLKLILKLY